MSELKPCPFCGSKDIKAARTMDFVFVECSSCGATGPLKSKLKGPRTPASAWNNRHTGE